MSERRIMPSHRWTTRLSIAVICAACFGLLLAGLSFSVQPLLQGWLVGFVMFGGICVGSLVLLLIGELTGGSWVERLRPVLLPCAVCLLILTIAFLPVAFSLPKEYRWAQEAISLRPELSRLYLNQPLFIVRSFVALFGWSALAILLVRRRCSALMAAAGLAFYGITISLVAIDWVLTIEVGFGSSAFAAGFAIQQILSALAFAAVVAPEQRDRISGDLGSLLLAALLGTAYLDLMSFIVSWYGDLPDKAAWYLRRSQDGWEWVIVAAVIIGVLIPLAVLINTRLRANSAALRCAGSLILAGVLLHILWLMAPTFEKSSIPIAVIAFFGLVGLAGAAARPIAFQLRRRGYG
jgi:hypothetical protein